MIKKENKKNWIIGVAVLLWGTSFLMERLSFDMAARESHLGTYLWVKVLLFGVLLCCGSFLVQFTAGIRAITKKQCKLKNTNIAVKTVLYAVPLFVCVSGIWILRGAPMGYEESSITQYALGFDVFNGVFTYLTSYAHMMIRMFFPGVYAVPVGKIVFLSLLAGYCAARIDTLFGTSLAVLLYFFILVPPALTQSYSIHRSPFYGPIYMAFLIKLLCDWKEKRTAGKWEWIMLAFVAAILSQWRSEGIYLALLGPVVMAFAYRIRPTKKNIAWIAGVNLLFQIVVWIPQASITTWKEENYNAKRSQPFYDYVLTGMLRNGMNREKNREDLEICDRFIRIDVIDRLNAFYGDHAYDEGYATYGDTEFSALVEGTTDADMLAYEGAVRRMILRNPFLYIRTQIGGFSHISTHYESICLSAIFGNLWVTAAWVVGLMIWALACREWCLALIMFCPFAHAGITTILLPAAYFKYYYPEYLFAGAMFAFMLCRFLANRCRHNRRAEEK